MKRKYPYSLAKGLTSTQIAIIVAVIVIVIIIGVIAGFVLTKGPSTTPVTTTVTSTFTTTTTIPTTTTSTSSNSVVFYTWWGGGDGGEALSQIIPAVKQYTGLQMQTYSIPGAGGTNAKYAILALIQAGKPPAAFQVHYGPEMISYVEAAPNGIQTFVNMTPYLEQWGLLNNAVYAVLQAGAYNGTLLSVPINVHRGAVLYVNTQLLREYNLPFPYNFSTLVYDTVQLANHGVSPWIIPGGDGGWDQFNVWEDIFLYLAGPQMYNQLIYGTLNFSNPTVQKLINETNYWFLNFTSYNYPGWQSMSWEQGFALLAQGKVAFQANGNWVTNYASYINISVYPPLPQYISNSSVSVVETPFPGTQHYYALVIDTIGIPVGPQEQQALQLAHFWSSYQGQEVWTKYKAVTYYKNGTDWYAQPAQWYDYQQLINTSEQNFVYQLSDGGVFDDVFAQIDSGLLTLQQVGKVGLSAWNSTLVSAMQQEQSEWLAAAKLGLGYLGFPGHPFAGYYPPWVTNPSAYGLNNNMHKTSNSTILFLLPFLVLSPAIASIDKKYYLLK
ncbi:glucose ABC transporter substrate-binding protein GlcS [Saccharolobus shibatae]|uniref:Glucose ABC transporter, substrate-binding protein n=1 Tax=Saccharolobus shibatae TaxID=2286 RepID=A0A8F5GVF7_9CREN|nr:glucose ABC transporter substrate-binding protein GlcS [Saccharolobus shibatae]QXJ31093.1 Glucose ABC transporter, substrate-binding protein [Saccharolobus shibatae]